MIRCAYCGHPFRDWDGDTICLFCDWRRGTYTDEELAERVSLDPVARMKVRRWCVIQTLADEMRTDIYLPEGVTVTKRAGRENRVPGILDASNSRMSIAERSNASANHADGAAYLPALREVHELAHSTRLNSDLALDRIRSITTPMVREADGK